MWTDTTGKQYARSGHGLPNVLTDEEWAVIEPFLPPCPSLGRPVEWSYRDIVDGPFYVLLSGLPWRMLLGLTRR